MLALGIDDRAVDAPDDGRRWCQHVLHEGLHVDMRLEGRHRRRILRPRRDDGGEHEYSGKASKTADVAHHQSESMVKPIIRPQATTAIQIRIDSAPAIRAEVGVAPSCSHFAMSLALMPWKIIMLRPAAAIRHSLA